jgi:hypothetical protein
MCPQDPVGERGRQRSSRAHACHRQTTVRTRPRSPVGSATASAALCVLGLSRAKGCTGRACAGARHRGSRRESPSLDVAGGGGLHGGVDEALATAHGVEEELLCGRGQTFDNGRDAAPRGHNGARALPGHHARAHKLQPSSASRAHDARTPSTEGASRSTRADESVARAREWHEHETRAWLARLRREASEVRVAHKAARLWPQVVLVEVRKRAAIMSRIEKGTKEARESLERMGLWVRWLWRAERARAAHRFWKPKGMRLPSTFCCPTQPII